MIFFAVISSVSFHGCIKQVDVDTRTEEKVLVVEGSVTTEPEPYTVKLSYSGPYTRGNVIADEFFEKNAIVSISDDLANTTSLTYKEKGIYETTDPNYIGRVGRSYSVSVILKDGRKYVSTPEKITPPVAIEKIETRFNFYTPSSLGVYLNVSDPASQENYYRWSFYSWAPRKTNGISCGIGCIMYEYCFQKVTDSEYRVFSDEAINGNKIKQQFVGVSPIYWFGKHYIDIRQHSISREAYLFSVRFNEQQTRTGSILDPLPATIKGNVFNSANPTDFALGYFSASSVTHKRAILIPFSITQFLLDQSVVVFIPRGPKICFEAFENTLPYAPSPALQNPPPPGWENAEMIEVRW